MNRHFYLSDDLDELEQVESELEANGISMEQIHVLSENDAELKEHHLHNVSEIMKKDLVHSSEIGAVIGILIATLILSMAYILNWTETSAGWTPFIFLGLALLAFGIWEGGFIGIQRQNTHFRRFKRYLRNGKHLFFVDLKENQTPILNRVLQQHPKLETAGTGPAPPIWIISWQKAWHSFKRIV